uniref:RIMS binding protein 2 n=1 Tax=Hippocampus comes TaxID=109280 RepID=A0A3Q3DX17_HIPCM
MREVAERRQQLELEHEQALAILKFKQDEIKRLQRSKVRDLEEKCRSQSEQFGLLSRELEKFRLQASKANHAGAGLLNHPGFSLLTNGVGLSTERGKSHKQRQKPPNWNYNPYDGPNDNPEMELPLTAGEYIYVYGGVDDDGFYEGELVDGRRGLVPSNFVERVSDDDVMASSNSALAVSAPLTNGLDVDLEEVGVDTVPYPRKLTLIKQLAKSIIISWDPPLVPAGWGNVWSYNVYVDQELRLNVPFGAQTKAVLERLDINLKAYRVSVQSLTEKGLSDQLRCSMLIGRDVCVAPTQLRVDRVTATSANLSWLPSNSNYVHIVSLNEQECELVKAGSYSLCLNNLLPSLQYTVKVEARPHRTPWELPVERRERRSASINFSTRMAGPPDAPLDVQLEHGPSPGIALISWLPVTIDCAGTSNGVRVTGYTIYADKKKVLEVSSPTAGSALLGPSQIQSLQAAQELTVRTMSAHGESCDSFPVNVPSRLPAIMAGPVATTPVVPPLACNPVGPTNLASLLSLGNSAAKASTPLCPSPPDTHISSLTVEAASYGAGLVEPPGDYVADSIRSDLSDILEEEEEELYYDHLVEAPTRGYTVTSGRVLFIYLIPPSILAGCFESPKTKGDNSEFRIFVALFPYDPATMSPNPDAAEEELPFREGQIITVYGDKDSDGFYRGESAGRLGYVPCNMVSEIQVEDEETRQQLLQQGFLTTPASIEKIANSTPGSRRMVAIFDYDPRESSPNTDIEGDLNGQRGLVPSNFLQALPEDAPAEHVSAQPAAEPKKESQVAAYFFLFFFPRRVA